MKTVNITKKGFVRYLSERLDTRFKTSSAVECPIARYIRHTHPDAGRVGDILVGPEYVIDSRDSTMARHKRWVADFINRVDISTTLRGRRRTITGAQCLTILQTERPYHG